MIPKVWTANLVLACLIVFFGIRAYEIWYGDTDAGKEERAAGADEPAAETGPGGKSVKRAMPAESAYDIVAVRNLFAPDREEYLPDEAEAETETETVASKVRISGKTITLYGIVITSGFRKALIDNPARGDDEPRNRWISVGDVVENLTVAAIENESVLFVDGAKKYEVPLYDKQKKRGSAKVARKSAPHVISTEPPQRAEAPKKTEAPKKAAPAEGKDPKKYKTVQTPFGDIVKPVTE